MSTKTQEKPRIGLVLSSPNQKPLFSPEFIQMMKDAAYETLRAYLRETGAPEEAKTLLEDFALLCAFENMKERNQVSWIENQSVVEALGAISYNIVSLGGASMLRKEME